MKKATTLKSTQAGFTLIETFVAILILVFAVIGPLGLLARAINDGNFAKNQITAHYLAQEAAEYVIFRRNQNLIAGNGWLEGLNLCTGGGSTCQIDVKEEAIGACDIEASNGCLLYVDTSAEGVKYYTHTSSPEASIFRREVEIVGDTSADDGQKVTVNVTVKWRNKTTDSSFTLPVVLLNHGYVAPQI